VGIVLVLGLLIFAVGVFTLGGQKHTFSSAFPLKAVFSDVNGLQKGNNIWFSGVKVGTISSVHFSPSADVVVSMNVDNDIRKFIHKDALAKVSTDGLIGNKIIVIYGGNEATPVVEAGDTLGVRAEAGFEGMMDTLQQNNRNLLAITSTFRQLSENIAAGKGTAGKLLTQDDMANTLQSALVTLRRAADNAEAVTDNLSRFSRRLNEPGSFADDVVSDTVVFRKLRQSAHEIQAASANIHEAAEKLNDPNNPIGLLLNDSSAAANLRATLQNLNGGTAKFEDDMEALQHNFLLRGFFKKKSRREADSSRR
jgi:phospholipid/cholesterol/gamma-HCH transport system substrate-binding protein